MQYNVVREMCEALDFIAISIKSHMEGVLVTAAAGSAPAGSQGMVKATSKGLEQSGTSLRGHITPVLHPTLSNSQNTAEMYMSTVERILRDACP